jgi:DNA adenine methylase
MRTIFRYPGAKTKLLKFILPAISPLVDNVYNEAFVGGGSVLLAVAEKHPGARLRVNDLDPLLSAFWTLLAEGSAEQEEEFIRRIRIPVTVERFYRLRASEPADLVDKAYRALFFNRTTFSGIQHASPIGGRKQKSKWTVDCRYNTEKLVEGYQKMRKLLWGRLEVSCKPVCAFLHDLLPESPCYLDPPYYVQGKALYPTSMTHEDHADLAQALRPRSNWVLSYDDVPPIRVLYQWANVGAIPVRYSIKGEKKDWASKVELLIQA